MGWFGKIVGGTFGLVFGGPLGMIAGAAFGHLYDASSTMHSGAGGQQRITNEEQIQMVFFVAAFSMLAKIATVDGGVTEAERRKIDEFIDRDLQLQGESRQAAGKIFQTAQHDAGTFDQFALQFYQVFRTNPQMLDLMVDILCRVSYADGRLTQGEEALIQRAGRIFRLTPGHVDSIRSRYSARGSSHSSYAVLGIEESASDDEVKRAYRKLVGEYHPDKIASKGLPEEFITFAHDKFREIQNAYDDIRKSRGM